MKKILSFAIMLLGGAALLSSCSSDRDSNPTFVTPSKFVLNEPSWRGAIVELENTTDSLTLTWSAPTFAQAYEWWGLDKYTYNAAVVTTYSVEFSPKGSFTKLFDANAEDNSDADYIGIGTATTGTSIKFGAKELNSIYQQFYGWESAADVPNSLKGLFRVKASVLTATNESYSSILSNTVSITVLPYFVLLKPADPEIWYLLGSDIADGSWGSDLGSAVIPMQTIEDVNYSATTGQGKIQWIGYLGGNGFKLRGNMDDGWATQWGQGASFGDFVMNDGGSSNITVPSAGIYTVTLYTDANLAATEGKNQLTVEPYANTPRVFTGMSISGSFNDWGDTPMNPSSTAFENHDWYLEHTFKAGDEVKIKETGSWDYNKGGEFVATEDGMYAYGVDGGYNLWIGEDATYLILFNDITGYIRFIKK